jgi:beta-lactamase regulating signal transducer with metallopeptidase domain
MLDVLAQAALRTLLLAAIVQLGLVLLRIRQPHLRLTAWTVVLAASLAMPALQWASPLRLPIMPALSNTPLVETAISDPDAPFSTPAPIDDSPAPNAAIPWPAAPSLLTALYLMVAGLLLARLAVGIVLSLRLVRTAAPIHPDWARDTPIRISRTVLAPVTVANVILLPPDVMTWPAPMRDAVLAHERAHIARWDFAMLLASQVNRAMFWFNPLSWWLHHRLAALAELASDDQAMAHTGNRAGYAEVLLEMARRSGPVLRGLAMARPATLAFRIERILSQGVQTNPASPIQQAILALGAACLSIVAASSAPDTAAPPGRASSYAQPYEQPSAGLTPTALAQTVENAPEFRAAWTEAPPQPVPPTPAASVSYPPPRPALAQVQGHQRPTPTLPQPHTLVQRVRTLRDQGPHDVSFKPWPPRGRAPAAPPRTVEAAGTANIRANAPGTDHKPSPPAAEPVVLKHEEPSCTGVYQPRPGGLRADGSVDVVQASYFQEADGTPWLKLFLGSRTRARLTGFDVDRTSIRTTVVTTLPKGTNHVTGTTNGPYGTIDFECTRPNARL